MNEPRSNRWVMFLGVIAASAMCALFVILLLYQRNEMQKESTFLISRAEAETKRVQELNQMLNKHLLAEERQNLAQKRTLIEQKKQAENEQHDLELLVAESLLRPFKFKSPSLTELEWQSILELASLDEKYNRARLLFLGFAVQDVGVTQYPTLFVKASIGLSEQRRQRAWAMVLEKLKTEQTRPVEKWNWVDLTLALGEPDVARGREVNSFLSSELIHADDPESLMRIARTFSQATRRLSRSDTEILADAIGSKILTRIVQATRSEEIQDFALAFLEVVSYLRRESRQDIAKTIAEALQKDRNKASELEQAILMRTWVKMIPHVDPEEKTLLLRGEVKRLELGLPPEKKGKLNPLPLAEQMTLLAPLLEPATKQKLAKDLSTAIVKESFPTTNHFQLLNALGALLLVMEHLNKEDRLQFADQAAKRIEMELDGKLESSDREALSERLAELQTYVSEPERRKIADRLLAQRPGSPLRYGVSFSAVLPEMAKLLPANDRLMTADLIAKELQKQITGMKAEEREWWARWLALLGGDQTSATKEELAKLVSAQLRTGSSLTELSRNAMAFRYLSRYLDKKESGTYVQKAAIQVLAGMDQKQIATEDLVRLVRSLQMVEHLSREKASQIASMAGQSLLDHLRQRHRNRDLNLMAEMANELHPWLDQRQIRILIKELFIAMNLQGKTASTRELEIPLLRMMAGLADQDLIELLKLPVLTDLPERMLLAELSRRFEQRFDNVWDMIVWVKKNRTDLKLP